MSELFPVLCGILIGVISSPIRDGRRRTEWWLLPSLICGVAATVVSGEFELGWQYLLVDIPLAAVSGLGVMTLFQQLRHRGQATCQRHDV